MLGFIEYYESDKTRPYLRQEQRAGGSFLVLSMGRAAHGLLAPHRALRAARQLRERGVYRAVFPVDFPHTAIFLRAGITPIDPLPLRCALAASFVQRELQRRNASATDAIIAVSGLCVTSELAETTRTLALRYRYVLLSVRTGGEELERRLRREYGISLLTNPSRGQLERADALALFSPRSDLRCENPVLCALYPGGERGRGCVPLQPDAALLSDIAPNCPLDQLAAALHTMGILPARRCLGEITC